MGLHNTYDGYEEYDDDEWGEEDPRYEEQAFEKITNYLEEAVKCYRNAIFK